MVLLNWNNFSRYRDRLSEKITGMEQVHLKTRQLVEEVFFVWFIQVSTINHKDFYETGQILIVVQIVSCRSSELPVPWNINESRCSDQGNQTNENLNH